MKQKSVAVIVAASTMALTFAEPSIAQDHILPDMTQTCSAANVAGVFGFNEHTLTSTVAQQPLALVGILDLRADGTASIQGRAFAEPGGAPIMSPIIEGEWTVEPNCTGFIDFEQSTEGPGSPDMLFVAVENATELFIVRNNPLEELDAKLLFRR